jgi:hypothetical protein
MLKTTILLGALSALIFPFAAKSQDPPKPVLLDEFGALPCDDLLGRTDALLAELSREPSSEAVILIYKPNKHPELATSRRRLIWSTVKLRGLEPDRFSFYRRETSPDGDIRTQFWRVPLGADAPTAGFENWPDEKPDTSRPFVFGYVDEVNECPTYVPQAFAKLILENPGSRGHIVLRTSKSDPIVNRFGFADGFVKELVEQHGVPRKRLHLFFARGEMTEAEF